MNFTVNGKTYKAKPFDFNMICDLEGMGISLQDASNKPMSMVRAYFGMCMGRDNATAGREMEQHIIGGGTFDDIMSAMSDEMEKSDFFRALGKTAAAENGADEETETAAK